MIHSSIKILILGFYNIVFKFSYLNVIHLLKLKSTSEIYCVFSQITIYKLYFINTQFKIKLFYLGTYIIQKTLSFIKFDMFEKGLTDFAENQTGNLYYYCLYA